MKVSRQTLHEICDLVSRLLKVDGYTCLDAEFESHTRTLRLFIDHSEAMNLDHCAKVSHILVEASELDDLIPGEYQLEISSPGIDRPVRTLQEFQSVQNSGESIEVKLTEKFLNRRNGVGQVVDIGDDDMILMKTTEGSWKFPWHMVQKASKQVDWSNYQEQN